MSESDQPSFTVVDKRQTGNTSMDEHSDTEAATGTVNVGSAEKVSTDPESPNTPVSEQTDSSGTKSEDTPFMPDPGMLLSFAAMSMKPMEFMDALLPIFDSYAWQSMGLVASKSTGEIAVDLPTASVAIDCVQFLLSKVEANLPDSERREAQRRLSDLRMNYVARKNSGA